VVGDKIYVVDDYGNTLAFIVRFIQLFDQDAESDSVFYSNDGKAHLNIITCEGVWNKINDTYPDRRVVFTDAIPGEGPVVIKKITPSTPKVVPSLPQTDVAVSLENIEIQPTFFQKLINDIVDSFKNIGK